jgi:hypothetical protein
VSLHHLYQSTEICHSLPTPVPPLALIRGGLFVRGGFIGGDRLGGDRGGLGGCGFVAGDEGGWGEGGGEGVSGGVVGDG